MNEIETTRAIQGELVPRARRGTLVRFQQRPGGTELLPGETLWEEKNPNALRAMVRRASDAGQLVSAGPRHEDVHGAWMVVRLRPADPRWPWYVGAVSLGMGALVGIGAMIWHSRWVWLTLAGIALAVWLAITLMPTPGHRSGCSGYHCPGCRG